MQSHGQEPGNKAGGRCSRPSIGGDGGKVLQVEVEDDEGSLSGLPYLIPLLLDRELVYGVVGSSGAFVL